MPRRRRLIRATLALSSLLLLASCGETPNVPGVPGAPASPSGGGAGAITVPSAYRVTISGTVSGNAFTRDAEITLHPTFATEGTENGVNPFDVCLRSGFPAGTPQVGAIWFGTNTGCFGAPQRIDAATVEVNGRELVARPDDRLNQLMANGWTAADGTAACFYVPREGSLRLRFAEDGSLEGSLEMGGFVAVCGDLGTSSTYAATITGVRADAP